MGATLALNGSVLGNVTDQFLRYEFSLNDAIRQTTTETMTTERKLQGFRTTILTITFYPDIVMSVAEVTSWLSAITLVIQKSRHTLV
jgi:hypothetical protein